MSADEIDCTATDGGLRTINLTVRYRLRMPADAPLIRLGVKRSLDPPPLYWLQGEPSPEGGQGTICSVPVVPDFLTFQHAFGEGDGWDQPLGDFEDWLTEPQSPEEAPAVVRLAQADAVRAVADGIYAQGGISDLAHRSMLQVADRIAAGEVRERG